ncbi:MAG TPA: fumarylacetoacetase [Bryobacteraceae bacterium]
MIDETHDPALQSWVASANASGADFPVQNLPFGTYRRAGGSPRLGVAIGDQALDATAAFGIDSLRQVLEMTAGERRELRRRISDFLVQRRVGAESLLTPLAEIELLLPCDIGDYTDFYASIHHATNVGSMFRPDNPLLPNYKWLPVGYHGRASSIVVSGTPVRRPRGQIVESPGGPPVYAPSRRLDYELEVGAFIGPGNALGEPIPVAEAGERVAGLCLVNDWSARDIQTWEYQPLGPFLAKNFATSISPWMVTTDALEPFRRAPEPRPASDPQPLPHLAGGGDTYDLTLEVWLRSAHMDAQVRISRVNFATAMYWTFAQMVAHHSSNGCNFRAGDLIASGTVSGPEKGSRGCLLEEQRGFLEDGDEVIFRGWCEAPGRRRIGLGECRGVVFR